LGEKRWAFSGYFRLLAQMNKYRKVPWLRTNVFNGDPATTEALMFRGFLL